MKCKPIVDLQVHFAVTVESYRHAINCCVEGRLCLVIIYRLNYELLLHFSKLQTLA